MTETSIGKPSPPKNGRLATAAGVFLCVFLVLMLLCNLTIIIKGTLNPQKPPSIFGFTPLVVLSGSMSGTQEGHIEIGDLVFVKETTPENLQVGDVIAYMSDEVSITHRITKITTSEDGSLLFTTKGDANNTEDTKTVTEEQLIGLYQGKLPKVGDFALFLQTPLGMFVFIGVPLMAFIIYDIIRRQHYANLERANKEKLEEELARLRSLAEKNKQSDSNESTNIISS